MLILTNLLWLCIFLFTSFKQVDENKPKLPAPAYDLVEASLADMMGNNFRLNYINPTRNVGTKKESYASDSRSVWFSLAKLESFIADMKAKSPLTTGIRFYFIQYPNDVAQWNKYNYLKKHISPSYKNHHTLMLVPTYFDGTYDMDFDPRRIGGDGKPMHMVDVMNSLRNVREENAAQAGSGINKAYILMPYGTSSSSEYDDPNIINGGSLVPPYPPGGSARMADASSTKIGVPIGNKISCSGATLLPYFDYKSKCGVVPLPLKDAIKD